MPPTLRNVPRISLEKTAFGILFKLTPVPRLNLGSHGQLIEVVFPELGFLYDGVFDINFLEIWLIHGLKDNVSARRLPRWHIKPHRIDSGILLSIRIH